MSNGLPCWSLEETVGGAPCSSAAPMENGQTLGASNDALWTKASSGKEASLVEGVWTGRLVTSR